MDSIKRLGFAHGIPLGFHNVRMGSDCQIEANASTRNGGKQDFDVGVSSEDAEHTRSACCGQCPVKAHTSYGPLAKLRLEYIEGPCPRREYNTRGRLSQWGGFVCTRGTNLLILSGVSQRS